MVAHAMISVALASCFAMLSKKADALPTPTASVSYEKVDVAPGITLDVAVAGNGSQPVIFLHGYPEVSWLWRGVIDPMLADGADFKL